VQALRSGRVAPALAGLLLLVGTVELTGAAYPRWPLGLVTYAVGVAALLFARTRPLGVPPLVASVYALTPLVGFDVSQPASWALLLALAGFAAGAFAPSSRWPLGLASVLSELAIAYAGLAWLTSFGPSLLFGLVLCVGPWGLGLALRVAFERERRAAVDVERARLARGRARESAVLAERVRIAGELNDLLAHALGAMVVQASAAAELIDRDRAQAGRALAGVADAGREALAETGRLLRVLRDEWEESERPEVANSSSGARQRIPWRDVVVPAGLGVIATVEIVSHHYEPVPLTLGAFCLAAAVLVVRRAAPLVMPAATIAILLGAAVLGVPIAEPVSTALVVGFAAFAAGRHAGSRPIVSLAALAAALVPLVVGTVIHGDLSGDSLLVFLVLAPWAVGVALRAALVRAHDLAAAAERSRLEAETEAQDALARERRRIARELHDLLARSLSIMTIQASLAAEIAEADPLQAAAAVAEVEVAGRAALRDSGRLLRVIRDGSRSGTHPQPGVADLEALADECARWSQCRARAGGPRTRATWNRGLHLPHRRGGAYECAQARAGQRRPRPARAH